MLYLLCAIDFVGLCADVMKRMKEMRSKKRDRMVQSSVQVPSYRTSSSRFPLRFSRIIVERKCPLPTLCKLRHCYS